MKQVHGGGFNRACTGLGASFFTLLLLVGIAGCGQQSKGSKLRIAVIPKGTTHAFWRSVRQGAEQAAKELGDVEIIWKGPVQESDTSDQITVVKNMITQRVDGICLAPNDSTALKDVVVESNLEGIPVVIFDSGLEPGPEIVSYVATDNEHGGALAADRLAAALGGQGNVILLRYRAGSESTQRREEGFLKAMAKHTGIRVVSSDQYGEATPQSALEKAQQLFISHRDDPVNGIFAVCEPNCNGVLLALIDSGLAGKVKFVAFDPSESLINGLQEGKVHGIVLQDPVQMGYLAVKSMVDRLRGKPVEKRIATGEHVATPENMKEPKMHALLHPAQF